MLLPVRSDWRRAGWACGMPIASRFVDAIGPDLLTGEARMMKGRRLKGIPCEGVSFLFTLAAMAVYASGQTTDDSEEHVSSSFRAALHRVMARSRLEMSYNGAARTQRLTHAMAMIIMGYGNSTEAMPSTHLDAPVLVRRHATRDDDDARSEPPLQTPAQYLIQAIKEREQLMNAGLHAPTDAVIAVWMELLFAYQRVHTAQQSISRCFRQYMLQPKYLFSADIEAAKKRRLQAGIEGSYAAYASMQTKKQRHTHT